MNNELKINFDESLYNKLENINQSIISVKESLSSINSITLDEFVSSISKIVEQMESMNKVSSETNNAQLIMNTSISSFTAVITILNAATKLAEISLKNFSSVMIGLPYIGVIAGISAVIGIIAGLVSSMDTQVNKHKETMEAINAEVLARNDLRAKQEEQLNANLSEVSNVGNLNNELKNLINANGEVKAGYEDRAAFIVSVLNKALGEQISIENGVVVGYDNANNAIDNKIAKLRAEAVLEAQLPAYKEALINATNAQVEADKLEAEYLDLNSKKKAKEAELQAKYGDDWYKQALGKNDLMLTEWANLSQDTKNKEEEFKKQDEITKGYYDDIASYETNAALLESGNAENYAKIQMDSAVAKATSVAEKQAALENEIEAETNHIEYLKELKANEMDEAKQKELQNQIEAEQLKLDNNQKELDGINEQHQRIVEAKQINNAQDLEILGGYIGEKQGKLTEMYATDEAKWTEEQKKEAESLKNSITDSLNTYSQYATDKVSKAVELSSKINENSTQEEIDAAASARREAEESLKVLGNNAIDKLNILEDLKNKRANGDKSITDSMIKEAERQAVEAETGYAKVAKSVSSSWESLPEESRTTFENVMKPMMEEMEKKEPSLFEKASGIARGILGNLKKAFDINSPSKKVKAIFHSVMEGAEIGLDDKTPKLLDQTEEIATNVIRKFSSINDQDVTGMMQKMKSAVMQEQHQMASVVDASIRHEVSMPNKILVELPEVKGIIRGNIENHILMDGRETAIQLTPFISEELAFSGM